MAGMPPPLLTLQDIRLTFGGDALLNGAELAVSANDRLCLVGRNGSGKSSLMKIAAGLIEPDSGTRFVQPGATVRYLPQEPDLSGFETVLDYVEAGLAPGDEQHRAAFFIESLGLTGRESPKHLSGGEARRAALAHVMAPAPDILLLDEPTNHLDLPAIEWLEAELKAMKSALVLISHDRRFLETLSTATVWLDRGQVRRMNAGFGEFEAWRDEVLEREQLEHHKLERKIAMEEDWLRYGVTARRKRNQGRLRNLQALREAYRTAKGPQGNVVFGASSAEASGKLVIEAKGIAKSYNGRAIVKPFSVRIARGDRIGVVGPNGAGKTTLINMLCGLTEPDEGTVRLGANLEMVTLDQRRESLKADWTLGDALTGGGGDMVLVQGEKRHVISYMKDFLFDPIQQRTPISRLSGGERGRLMLARALARPANLLVLDEPTNDLDLETLDLLQEMLAEFAGTVILVSHDRDFIDRVATSVIVSEGDGRWIEYAGGYSDMLAQKQPAAAQTKAPARKTASAAQAKSAQRQPKMSFKDKHALETLPARIEELEVQVKALRDQMSDPGLYARDPDAFKAVAADLEACEAELRAAEDQWLELEMLRDELENT